MIVVEAFSFVDDETVICPAKGCGVQILLKNARALASFLCPMCGHRTVLASNQHQVEAALTRDQSLDPGRT